MLRLTFSLAVLASCVASGFAPPPASAQTARINDIEISRDGETVSLLVTLSEQPRGATATATGNGLVVEIDGLALTALAFDPAPGHLVTRVAAEPAGAAMSKVTLSGAGFGKAATTIYRNAVLIETALAEGKLKAASTSLLTVAKTNTPDAPHPVEPKKGGLAALAGLDDEGCAKAASDLQRDPWLLAAMGDHALCLIDAGQLDEAINRLDQLAAFSPEDWRVVLGRASLAAVKGDASHAEIGYRNAAMLAPDEATRMAIMQVIPSLH